jgi:hypothetical protein
VCAIALLVLQNEVEESHASVFIDSSIVGAMLALLQPGEIAIALGRVILKDRSCTDIAGSDDEYSAGAKRGRNSMTATTDAKKKQKS